MTFDLSSTGVTSMFERFADSVEGTCLFGAFTDSVKDVSVAFIFERFSVLVEDTGFASMCERFTGSMEGTGIAFRYFWDLGKGIDAAFVSFLFERFWDLVGGANADFVFERFTDWMEVVSNLLLQHAMGQGGRHGDWILLHTSGQMLPIWPAKT